MKKVILFLICICPLYLLGQNTAFLDRFINNTPISQRDISAIGGSPYMHKDFLKGTVFQSEKMIGNDIELRFNVYNNEIEFRLEEDKIYNIPKNLTLNLITIGKEQFVFRKVKNGSKGIKALQMLHDNKFKLLKLYKTSYQKAQPAKAMREPIPATFKIEKPTYYIEKGDNTLFKVKSIKDIAKSFPRLNKEIKSESKKNRLKFKDEDLVKLVLFIETKI
ncbi:hypothetical protein EMN47_19440 [Prolixibacteraceae bacterium JC049]|nr:hypothetical protein [Prolixibacteraceae bacterium JC049]